MILGLFTLFNKPLTAGRMKDFSETSSYMSS